MVEPLNRFETDILSTTGQAVRPIDAVASPAVGLLLDTFHMHMEEGDAVAAIPSAGDRLVHFQANENRRGILGTGTTDWPAKRALDAVVQSLRRGEEARLG